MSTVQRQQQHNHPQQKQKPKQLDAVHLDNSAHIPVNLDGHEVPRRTSIGQITVPNSSVSGGRTVRSSGRAGGTTATSLAFDAAVSSGRPPDDQPLNASTITTTTTTAAAAAASGGLKQRSASPAATLLERRLDDSVETVYREWDSGLRSRTETTLAVRPVQPGYVSLTPSLLPVRRQRPAAAAAAPSCDSAAVDSGSRQAQRRPVSVDVVQSNNISKSSRRNEVNSGSTHINNGSGLLGGFSSGDDSFDDGGATSRPFHESASLHSNASAGEMTSSQRHNFHVEFDADGYEPSDVTVRVSDGRLVVHGVRQEADGGRRSTTEFCRKIRLPDDIDVTQLSCRMVDGRVILEAPRLHVAAAHQTDVALPSGRVVATSTADQPPLNVPVVIGDQLTLLVEVGRVFRADDVVVKVRNSTSTLTVSAERVEATPGSGARLNASLAWQFDLPAAVDVDSLRAGLTLDGLLRVTARLMQQQQQQQQTAESLPVVTVVAD